MEDDFYKSEYDKLNLPKNHKFCFLKTDRKQCLQEKRYLIHEMLKNEDKIYYMMDDDPQSFYLKKENGETYRVCLDDWLDNLDKEDFEDLASTEHGWHSTPCKNGRAPIFQFFIWNPKRLYDKGVIFTRDISIPEDLDISLQYYIKYGKLPLRYGFQKGIWKMGGSSSLASKEYYERGARSIYEKYKDLDLIWVLGLTKFNTYLKPVFRPTKYKTFYTLDRAIEWCSTHVKPNQNGNRLLKCRFVSKFTLNKRRVKNDY